MRSEIKTFNHAIAEIQVAQDQDIDEVVDLYEIVEPLTALEDPTPAFPAIFSLMERHPLSSIGNPGPLVHLLESTYPGGYETLLVNSLERAPSMCAVWMAGRLLNDRRIPLSLRSTLVLALRKVNVDRTTQAQVRESAHEFLELHETSNDRFRFTTRVE